MSSKLGWAQDDIDAYRRKQCQRTKQYRKLLLWYTPNFKPLFTHYDLEPIMSTLGFFPVYSRPVSGTNRAESHGVEDEVNWLVYKYSGASAMSNITGPFRSKPVIEIGSTPAPIAKLPYPRVDGLHLITYSDFLEAVNYYCGRAHDIFHLQGMPIYLNPDNLEINVWTFAYQNNSQWVYRVGTLDQALKDLYSADLLTEDDNNIPNRIIPKKKGHIPADDHPETHKMVNIDDIIVTNKQDSKSSEDVEGTNRLADDHPERYKMVSTDDIIVTNQQGTKSSQVVEGTDTNDDEHELSESSESYGTSTSTESPPRKMKCLSEI